MSKILNFDKFLNFDKLSKIEDEEEFGIELDDLLTIMVGNEETKKINDDIDDFLNGKTNTFVIG